MAADPHRQYALKGGKATVVGGGVIGASWTALFLANGMRVTVNDPDPDIAAKVAAYVAGATPSLLALGYPDVDTANLAFEADLARAVADADYVQECGPEKVGFKHDVWAQAEQAAPQAALLLSSSSGIPASEQSKWMQQPGRLVIGHPFNPPHLMPLVEVVPSDKTPPALTARALDFYAAVGKVPVEIKKESAGFVVNRLQTALFRECVSLVAQGVVSAGDADKLVVNSVGLRWATGGPFFSFHLGGGQGGFRHFIEHLGPAIEYWWKDMSAHPVALDEATRALLIEQVERAYGGVAVQALSAERDDKEVAVLKALERPRE